MITGIHHLSIIASSEESIDFYTSLGFKEKTRIKRSYDTVVLMVGNGIGLELFIDPNHPVRENPEPLGLRQVALRVDKLEETTSGLGVKVGDVQTNWNGKRYVVVRDPDGNVVQLCE